MQSALSEVIKEATLANPEESLALFYQKPWSEPSWGNRLTALSGYLAGLKSETDWRQTNSDLTRILIEEQTGALLQSITTDKIQTELASQWAKSNPSQALDWFLHENSRSGTNPQDSQNLAQVLRTALSQNSEKTIRWIQENQHEAQNWDNQILVNLGHQLSAYSSYPEPNEFVPTILTMLPDEPDRYKLIQHFTITIRSGNDDYLRHSPDNLHNLIRQANLSKEHQQTLSEKIDSALWSGT